MKIRVFCFLLVVVTFLGFCLAYPDPAVVPEVGDWTLDVVFEAPKQISVSIDGGPVKKRFWYTILSLTNNSGADVPFYPRCELMTDTFEIIAAGKGVRNVVFEKIKLRHQGKYPFLESLEFADHRVLQGFDNRKDIAIIWSDFDAGAKNVNLFISGLSNETVAVSHPIDTDNSGNPIKVFLRKTLMLDYSIGGDPVFRPSAKLSYTGKRWVMR